MGEEGGVGKVRSTEEQRKCAVGWRGGENRKGVVRERVVWGKEGSSGEVAGSCAERSESW